jgi:hypothetical protein
MLCPQISLTVLTVSETVKTALYFCFYVYPSAKADGECEKLFLLKFSRRFIVFPSLSFSPQFIAVKSV